MATQLVTILADFNTQLVSGVAIGDTTATIVSAVDDDNVALPTGKYGFTIDGDNSAKEYIVCTVTSTALTVVQNISRQGVVTTGFARAHRRGAKVTVTDWITLGKQLDLLNGTTDFDGTNPLGYDADPTLTLSTQFATKKYVDDSITAGAPNASETVKGIVEEATLAEVIAGTGTGGTGARLFVNPEKLQSSGITGLSLTASSDISINDTVYVTGANTVASLYPSAQGTGTAIATTATNYAADRSLPLSTNGQYLYVVGGDTGAGNALYASVRTMNAGETDLSMGAVQTIATFVNGYDIKSIGNDKFLLIFQKNNLGAADGISTCVITVSGTTVTVGATQSIETTGQLTSLPSVAKLNTDKALIVYKKDSDNKLYCQVLSVSGTTITTNTAVNVNNSLTLTFITQAVQLGTDSAAIVYGDGVGAGAALYGRTISVSGTTPTVNAEQTLVTQATSGWKIGLQVISATKLLLAYSESASTTNDQLCHIALSGATMTKSSNIALSSARNTIYFGMSTIGTRYALVADYTSATTYKLFLVDISGTAPVQSSVQTLTMSGGGAYFGVNITRISPWTYIVNDGYGVGDSDFIVKLTPSSSALIGVAKAAIASAAAGTILKRYSVATLSSITLTSGSIYYVNDDAQPTLNSSLTSPLLGIAINTTTLLLQ